MSIEWHVIEVFFSIAEILIGCLNQYTKIKGKHQITEVVDTVGNVSKMKGLMKKGEGLQKEEKQMVKRVKTKMNEGIYSL